jgi:hypothetical protein
MDNAKQNTQGTPDGNDEADTASGGAPEEPDASAGGPKEPDTSDGAPDAPDTSDLEEPSVEKDPGQEPKGGEGQPEADHEAVGIGVIGGPQVDPDRPDQRE